MFNNENFLSFSEGSGVSRIEDLEDVTADEKIGELTFHGEIVAVSSTDEYIKCLTCTAKVNEENGVIGTCSKCGLKMKIKCAQKTKLAKVKIMKTK